MKDVKKFLSTALIVVIVLVLVFGVKLAGLYTDYHWFRALGFEDIFTISLFARVWIFLAAAAFFALFGIANLWIASRFYKSPKSFRVGVAVILVLSFFAGLFSGGSWLTVLKFFNQTPFGLQDPILLRDASFYVFSLPFYMLLLKFLFACVIVAGIVTALYYLEKVIAGMFAQREQQEGVVRADLKQEFNRTRRALMVHSAVLAALLFVLLSVNNYLARFSVMYSESGIVVGAGYTDVHVFLPVVKILMVVAAVVAVLFLVWIFYFSKEKRLRKRHVIIFFVVAYLLVAFVGKTVAPGIVQSLVVSPNEINLEKPFIENNIEFTRKAYGLDSVKESYFDVQRNLTPEVLEDSAETIRNVRILDYRPLTETYRQTQEIRLYYDLSGIDIGRYMVDGLYTQVLLAPRELNQAKIPFEAQTWVNLHMVYTHGFGVVMSPVNVVTGEGLPKYLVKDIPPVYTTDSPGIRVDQPRVYYGEKDNFYVLVDTDTAEFDYPKGSSNRYIRYDGDGGVVLDTFLKKLAMALRLMDIKILLSSDIRPDSRVMFSRNIRERISKITPFLELDDDPYLVVDDGRMVWVQDAYTVTGKFPYSRKVSGINYIRNSVKVVVDAYDGDVTYYVVDPDDPLMQTYASIFPGQFRLFDDMPSGLREHIRYPEDLFRIQSEVYSTYHMDDVTVFYNKEDAWEIPDEIYGTGQEVKVEPYYIILRLPGKDEVEFVLMTTFTPIKKDNMIAWLAARCDGGNYGELVLFKFPKDKLIYGPSQIEAKIDQDSEISQQVTLWSQRGSRVTRGNLLVIPVDDSLLYIEPLYIQAEKGQLPELKRVIVSDGDRVVMEKDLSSGLRRLFGEVKESSAEEGEDVDLAASANRLYRDMLDSLQDGDWSGFGSSFESLGEVLDRMEGD